MTMVVIDEIIMATYLLRRLVEIVNVADSELMFRKSLLPSPSTSSVDKTYLPIEMDCFATSSGESFVAFFIIKNSNY